MTHACIAIPVQTTETAPGGAKEALKQMQASMGFVPNLMGILANAPALLEGYRTLSGIFDKTSFSPTERQVVLLAVSCENRCEYCVAAHTVIAGMQKVDAGVVRALREGLPIADGKLEALRQLATAIVRTNGWPAPEVVDRFTAAGFGGAQALEVVLGVGVKTLSNYANHLANTPLDKQFAPAEWKSSACGCGA